MPAPKEVQLNFDGERLTSIASQTEQYEVLNEQSYNGTDQAITTALLEQIVNTHFSEINLAGYVMYFSENVYQELIDCGGFPSLILSIVRTRFENGQVEHVEKVNDAAGI